MADTARVVGPGLGEIPREGYRKKITPFRMTPERERYKREFLSILAEYRWSVGVVARVLGVSRTCVYRRMALLGIEHANPDRRYTIFDKPLVRVGLAHGFGYLMREESKAAGRPVGSKSTPKPADSTD